MSHQSLISPLEATKALLKNLPSRRMRDVVEKRFGIKGGQPKTLQAIGREYKITRERVRQIESEALKALRRDEHIAEVTPVLAALDNHVREYGGVMAEHHLLSNFSQNKHHAHIGLLLDISRAFHKLPETDAHHCRWTIDKEKALQVEKVFAGVVEALEAKKKTVSEEELHALIASSAHKILGEEIGENIIHAYLAASKVIRKNPYHEFGLAWWPSVNPSGVKDKAYVAIAKAVKPLHFREVAEAINKAGWSKKKAHPQTVHNELIKDKRFVLVGRGLYALKEWGYEPGAVRDVIVSVLKDSGKPMTKEEIVQAASKKRMVKVPTILLNLQNKHLFRKTDDGKYLLA